MKKFQTFIAAAVVVLLSVCWLLPRVETTSAMTIEDSKPETSVWDVEIPYYFKDYVNLHIRFSGFNPDMAKINEKLFAEQVDDILINGRPYSELAPTDPAYPASFADGDFINLRIARAAMPEGLTSIRFPAGFDVYTDAYGTRAELKIDYEFRLATPFTGILVDGVEGRYGEDLKTGHNYLFVKVQTQSTKVEDDKAEAVIKSFSGIYYHEGIKNPDGSWSFKPHFLFSMYFPEEEQYLFQYQTGTQFSEYLNGTIIINDTIDINTYQGQDFTPEPYEEYCMWFYLYPYEQGSEIASLTEITSVTFKAGMDIRSYDGKGYRDYELKRDYRFVPMRPFDVTCTASGTIFYEETNTVPVVFYDRTGSVLEVVQVEKGGTVQAPELPEEEGYTFLRWDKDLSAINEVTHVYPVYEKAVEPGGRSGCNSSEASAGAAICLGGVLLFLMGSKGLLR